MSSEAITRNDLSAILNEVLPPTPSEYKKLLWTNPSPTTAYTSGTPVSADVASQYDAIEISFMLWTGYQSICTVDTAVKGQAMITTSIASSNNYVSGSRPDPLARAWDFTEQNGVRIYGGVEANFAVQGAYAQANHVLIPYQIYGIKYERVAPPQLETPIIQTLTVTAQTDANGYFHPPTSLNDAIPIWAEVSGRPTGLRPCFLTNGYTETERYGLRFKAWNDVVAYTSTTITVTIYYIKLVN